MNRRYNIHVRVSDNLLTTVTALTRADAEHVAKKVYGYDASEVWVTPVGDIYGPRGVDPFAEFEKAGSK